MAPKINLANISAGLSKVQAAASAMDEIATVEMVDTQNIILAANNPYAAEDNTESLEALAADISANTLLNPLVVNKLSDTQYQLISGERRYKAITQLLHWPRIECRVYRNLPDEQAQLMLHSANLETREYTTAQKLRFYKEMEVLLSHMKEDGTFRGAKQQKLADMLGVTTRQIRKYQTITEKLPDEVQQAVIEGKLSISDACKMAQPERENGFSHPPATPVLYGDSAGNAEEVPESAQEDDFIEEYPRQEKAESVPLSGSAPPPEIPMEVLKEAVSLYYTAEKLLRFYMFQVPTTQEAIKFLKPEYGYAGRSILFQDDDSGGIELRSASVDIRYCSRHYPVTYGQIDACVREMIRSSELKEEMEILLKALKGGNENG